MKIGVLFNCQHKGLAASLRQLLPGSEVGSYAFNELARHASLRASALSCLAEADVVVSANSGAELPQEDFLRLRAAARRVVTLPPATFRGFHPDTIYFTKAAGQVLGPTATLHSRLAVAAFLGGLDVVETAFLYNRAVFARLGYRDQFEQHMALFTERYGHAGIDIAPALRRWRISGCFMHSGNHPKAVVLHDLALVACAMVGFSCDAVRRPPPEDTLFRFATHPVLPDLADAIGVPPETLFKRGGQAADPPAYLTLDDFLGRCFAAYAKQSRDALRQGEGVAEAMTRLDLREHRA